MGRSWFVAVAVAAGVLLSGCGGQEAGGGPPDRSPLPQGSRVTVALTPRRLVNPAGVGSVIGACAGSAVLGEVPEGDRSADFGAFGADPGVEVLAAQAVAAPLSERISEWWMSRSIIAVAAMSSPKISPQAPNGLFEVTRHLQVDADPGIAVRAPLRHPSKRSGPRESGYAPSAGSRFTQRICVKALGHCKP
jgi:hypothetical protein